MSQSFEERYKKLNPAQKEAVDAIEGPVMVIAGPGTGKTEILTLRIANILRQTDTQAENILALTFTDSAAANMRKRLSNLIGSPAYSVKIETFHSFCNNVIKNYPEYFPTIIGSGNITEIESMAILEELIESLPLSILRPWGDHLYYAKSIAKKIEELKREGVTPEGFKELLAREEKAFAKRSDLFHEKGAYKGKMKNEHKDTERMIEKNKELQVIYEKYQEVLKDRRLYDWSDMIMEVLKALSGDTKENKDLKLYLQETHQYILVDEHQDTNNAQNTILELLCDFHTNPNIFIVGDEKQAIFRFQGASLENFNHLKKLYPEAKLIELSENYRSIQPILDAAHSIIASRTELLAFNKKDAGQSAIKVAEFQTKNFELHYVAETVQSLIKDGTSPQEIAIIYRSNKEAFPIADMLGKYGIGYAIESDEDLLSETFVRKFVTLSDAIFHYGDDEYAVPALHLDEFAIDPLDAYRLIHESSKTKKPLYDLIQVSSNEHIKAFGETLKSFAKLSKTEHLSQFLERMLRESGILSSMIASKDAEAFLGIERLFAESKRISENRPGATFADFAEYLSILRKHELFIKRPKYSLTPTSVRLMTAHRSKGLEFEYVFIVGATEQSFGPKRISESLPLVESVYRRSEDKDDEGTVEDERRLFYVALTRAKKAIIITHPTFDANGKQLLASPFVLALREDRVEKLDTKAFEERMNETPELSFAESKKTGGTAIDRDFVSDLFASRPLSVTALNNYLDCPWKYFYRNLLRIPAAPARHQIYGIAMHASVEDLWRTMKDRDVDANFLTESYKRNLGLQGILTEKEFEEALARGTEALAGWYAWAQPKLSNPVLTEFRVDGADFEGILLGGALDKVEVVGGSSAIVTDYKTGKQKSRNHIEGKTKDSKGDMLRQLQFYKLLLELQGKMTMKQGIIEFLEPNDAGNYSREAFEVSDEEVAELKETIRRVVGEIKTLSFWDSTCDDKDCEYCSYRTLLK
jgi:DNA helicase-2/ATP-dependent DNA helicase PcrA